EVVTRILPLRHAEATALVPVLQPLVSKDGLVTPYPATNTLVVVDAAANVERVAGLLHDLDAPSSERAVEMVSLRFAPADDPAPPPAEPRPHGSSLARGGMLRTESALGYDGGLGAPPPAAVPPPAQPEPASAGAAAAIPLAAPVRITADPATNTLIVSATPEDWETLRAVIEKL